MRTFACQVCAQPVYFENSRCTYCGATLGFLPERQRLSALEQGQDGLWRVPQPQPAAAERAAAPLLFARWFGKRPAPAAAPVALTPTAPRAYRKCVNYAQHEVCNWMVPADSEQAFCLACQPNQIIPNLARPGNLDKWYRLERSKRRLSYGLLRLGLPVHTKAQDPAGGLGFAFLSPQETNPGEPVLTGHANGLITINIDEAHAPTREQVRLDMDEQYRTLLGHFRHEIGHYYWDRLIRDGGRLEAFRAHFGDEQRDYGGALDAHHANGPPADWQARFVSAYAASHPWEDWSETFAHYLHIVDTLETSEHFGVRIEQRLPDGTVQRSDPDFDPYTIDDFQPIIDAWMPLTFALNSLSRSMGQPDLYPFVLSAPVIEKLAYVHRVVRESRVRG
ncbi:putative zinc-binding metallopeptidase [uncultured Thiohalocapsa sp.]|uniref:zinc-binding metallopeptidase family protein n=1 Tax=uncultured Thiohalocapsa sp. TaxID=768990 RepID=UPI0025E36124|nr:putative zinc-binding metallopeptidase [uncultured Thiohalocapsa sp.]